VNQRSATEISIIPDLKRYRQTSCGSTRATFGVNLSFARLRGVELGNLG